MAQWQLVSDDKINFTTQCESYILYLNLLFAVSCNCPAKET